MGETNVSPPVVFEDAWQGHPLVSTWVPLIFSSCGVSGLYTQVVFGSFCEVQEVVVTVVVVVVGSARDNASGRAGSEGRWVIAVGSLGDLFTISQGNDGRFCIFLCLQ